MQFKTALAAFLLASFWLALAFSATAVASPTTPLPVEEQPRSLGWLSFEFDPLTTPLGARNLFLSLEPPALPHWSTSLGLFASDFPKAIDNLMSYRNRDSGFDIRVRLSVGLNVDYFFSRQRSRWHVGVMMFLWRYEVGRNGDATQFVNHVVLPRIGYRWFPFESVNVYVDPFAGLMTEYTVSGEPAVDGVRFKPTHVLPFASAHLGFHF